MKVTGYTRVSTEEQAREGFSLGAQRAKIEQYAALYELDLVDVIEDAGVSGKTLERPGLSNVLSRITRGLGVVVAKLDRLTRSVKDWQTLVEDYFSEKAGRHLFSVADSIDTRSAAGRLVLNVLLSVSQWEREAIGERTRDALQHKIAKGELVGSLRYGYDLAPDGKTLVENYHEQEAIRFIKLWHSEGTNPREIARRLEAAKYPTKKGKKWLESSVRSILSRENLQKS